RRRWQVQKLFVLFSRGLKTLQTAPCGPQARLNRLPTPTSIMTGRSSPSPASWMHPRQALPAMKSRCSMSMQGTSSSGMATTASFPPNYPIRKIVITGCVPCSWGTNSLLIRIESWILAALQYDSCAWCDDADPNAGSELVGPLRRSTFTRRGETNLLPSDFQRQSTHEMGKSVHYRTELSIIRQNSQCVSLRLRAIHRG